LPISTSAQKAARTGERKRLRNRSIKSATKTYVTKAEKLIHDDELEPAQAAVLEAISVLDKAAKNKVIHPNTASRLKSRLTKKLNKAKLTTAASKTEATATEKAEKKTRKRKSKQQDLNPV
jgi:small subunit ribosomal protein S20